MRAFLHALRFACIALSLPAAVAASEPAFSPTLNRIRETGMVTLGYREESMPFSYLDAQRNPVGYSVDLCLHMVDAIRARMPERRLQIRLMPVSVVTRIPLVADGTVDLECGVTTNTAERRSRVGFSLTFFVAETRVMSRRGEGIRGAADLKGKIVVSTPGTTSMSLLARLNAEQGAGMKLIAGKSEFDAFQMLRNGRAQAFVIDDVLQRALLASAAPSEQYSLSEQALSVEPYAIMLPYGDAGFKAVVDQALIALYRSGEIRRIYGKWFLQPIPPSGLRLNLPMSRALQRAIAEPTDSPDPTHYR